nr:PTS permease [Salmonella sp. NCTC 7297]
MTQPNIVWTRIDERLLHGQIRITWGKHTEANLILVANDEAAGRPKCCFYAGWNESLCGW